MSKSGLCFGMGKYLWLRVYRVVLTVPVSLMFELLFASGLCLVYVASVREVAVCTLHV